MEFDPQYRIKKSQPGLFDVAPYTVRQSMADQLRELLEETRMKNKETGPVARLIGSAVAITIIGLAASVGWHLGDRIFSRKKG